MEREERDFYRDVQEFKYPEPSINYRDGEKSANVSFGGRTTSLPVYFWRDADIRYNGKIQVLIDQCKDIVRIDGFAARFPYGRRVWKAECEFVREDGEISWSYSQCTLSYPTPPAGSPATLIGFLKDFPAKDRGINGDRSKIRIRFRSRAGFPAGPENASDFDLKKIWNLIERRWRDENENPIEVAKEVGIPFFTLMSILGPHGGPVDYTAMNIKNN